MPTTPASGASVFRKFTTRAFSTGVATTLSGSPVVSVYKDNSTTQSTAGVTLTVDFDGVAGLNHVTIDTSADGTFYANGSHFELVITTGTVGGSSAIGYVVGDFDLEAAVAGATDWTADERTAIRSILGIPGAGTTPADPSVGIMDTIRDSVALRLLTSAYTAPDNTGIDAIEAALTAKLDVVVSTRAAASTALSTAQWTNTRATNLDNLDTTVSSRASQASVTTIDDFLDTEINTLLGYTSATGNDVLKILTAMELDGAVWRFTTNALEQAPVGGGGGDTPGTTTLLSRLTEPRATNLDNLNATVSSRSTYAGGAVASVTSGVTLTSAGLDAVTVESGLNARQAIAIIAAATAGGSSGVDTGTPATYKGAGVATTRITATCADGNRTSVTLAPPT